MSQRNTIVRSMHDVGLAVWFGGSLMGAVGLNGAAANARDPQERLELASQGWNRWTPINAAGIGAHVIGGYGLIMGNKTRLASQDGAQVNTVAKTVLTVVALGVTGFSRVAGKKVDQLSQQGGEGVTEPRPGASKELASAQQQLKWSQWAIPAITGVLLILGAQQGEQQRPIAG